MADSPPYLQKDWKQWFDDQQHPYIANLPSAAVAAFVASATANNSPNAYAVAAGASALAYFAFTAQNAFGYRSLDIVHSLAGGDLEKFRLYNAVAGGVAAAGGAYAYNVLAQPYQQPFGSLTAAIVPAVAATQYLTQKLGDQASIE